MANVQFCMGYFILLIYCLSATAETQSAEKCQVEKSQVEKNTTLQLLFVVSYEN